MWILKWSQRVGGRERRKNFITYWFTPKILEIGRPGPHQRLESGNATHVFQAGRVADTCCLSGSAFTGSWRQELEPGVKPQQLKWNVHLSY